MDLNDHHVIIPSDEYLELQTANWNQPPATINDRIAGTVQTALIFAAASAAFVAGAWGIAKVQNWHEERILQRRMREETFKCSNTTS